MDKLRRVLNGNDVDDEGQGFVPMPVSVPKKNKFSKFVKI